MQNSTLLAIIIIFAVLVTTAAIEARKYDNVCKNWCGKNKWVPYPFGFSKNCSIWLDCTESTGEIKFGGFIVRNITENSLVLEIGARCNRSIESLKPLFGQNYALSYNNNLLLQNCSKPQDACLIATNNFLSNRKAENCSSKTSCLPLYNTGVKHVLSYKGLNVSNCRNVFSSFVIVSDQPVLLEFERVQLDWWVSGNCGKDPCAKNAKCRNISSVVDVIGFKCQCNDGFIGDGYKQGRGCLSGESTSCNAKRYLTGNCGGSRKVGVLIGGIVAGALSMLGLAAICYFCRRRSHSLRNLQSAKRLLCEAAGNSSVPLYPYKEIEKATDGFAEKHRLGTGAYGTVYAGKLHNDVDEWVAIKKIRYRDTDSIDQVMNEIKLLSSVSHPNLVRLLGCCIEQGEPILVYEFMPNGTLSQHLQRERGKGLPWTIRLTIAAETANAITYLHSAINPPIYHRDIKSSNILLDYNYKSKVADFGLSRLGMTELSHVSTAPQGTPGYLDPQYHQYFHLSDKSDVYSFGVVLIEIITALKVVDFSRPHSEVNLAALAIDRIGRGCEDEIIDPYLDPHKDAWTLSSIHSVAELAFRCLAFHRDMRPTMREVAEELEQLRLSAWVPTMYLASPAISSCSSEIESDQISIGNSKKASRRLFVPRTTDRLKEVKDSSPVSVQDPWSSEQSSPSTSSLLNNVVQ